MALEKSRIYKMTEEKDKFGRGTKEEIKKERNNIIWDSGEMGL